MIKVPGFLVQSHGKVQPISAAIQGGAELELTVTCVAIFMRFLAYSTSKDLLLVQFKDNFCLLRGYLISFEPCKTELRQLKRWQSRLQIHFVWANLLRLHSIFEYPAGVLVLAMGIMGVGKSTFISKLTAADTGIGHDQTSCEYQYGEPPTDRIVINDKWMIQIHRVLNSTVQISKTRLCIWIG